MHSPGTRLDLMHDFRRNLAPKQKCNLDIPSEDYLPQHRAAGILEIVEAEHVTNVAALGDGIGTIIRGVAETEGFTVIEEPFFNQELGFMIMKEGYIAARVYPDHSYIGFDINLWGYTYKIKSLKSALVKAVGSSDVSSYKVVVGGMFGSNTWNKDQKLIGPKMKQLRNCQEDVVLEGTLDPEAASGIAAEEVLPLTLAKDITVAVVCGEEGRTCPVLNALSGNRNVRNLIHVFECPGLGDGDAKDAYTCEAWTLDYLAESVRKHSAKFNLVLLDGTASYKMHQILSSILDRENIRHELLESHNIVATWSQDLEGETWRREFLDRYRKQVHHDPVSRAEIVLQAGGKSFEFGVVSTKNKEANYAFEELENNLRTRLSITGCRIELRKVHGGLFNYIQDFKTKEFRHDDYDSSPGRAQFLSQMPLGSQNIFQLVKLEKLERIQLELSLPKILQYFEKASEAISFDFSTLKQYSGDVGDGAVIVAVGSVGSIIISWDGRDHVDINYFMFEESSEKKSKFINSFLMYAKIFQVSLRDDQPRGTGHVVNFIDDIQKPS